MDKGEKSLLVSLPNGLIILARKSADGFRVDSWKDLSGSDRGLEPKLVHPSPELRARRFTSRNALIEAVLREAKRVG